MAVKSEQVEKNLVKLTFEVSYEKFQEAMDKAYQQNKGKFNIPGFRKGKVPKEVIIKHYTEAIFYDDALNYVLPDAYDEALKESGVESVARPEIDVEDIEKGKPIVFTALVTTKPEMKLGKYKGVKIKKIDYNVSEEEIDNEIKMAQNRNARLITIDDRAGENGDIANIDFEGFVDGVAFEGGKGEKYDLEIGSGSFIPGFEEQIIGAKTGDDVEVNVTFPEEYHAADLAGKASIFKVKVNEIKKKELPELDDDFASEVSEFETFEEYKKSVKERLEKRAEDRAKAETENACIEEAVKVCEADIPKAMVDAKIDERVNEFAQRLSYQGMNLQQYFNFTQSNMEALRENMREEAEKAVKVSLMLENIVKKEGLKAEPEEIDEKLLEMAQMYGMEVEKLKEALRPEDQEMLANEVNFAKAIEIIVNNAVVK